MYLEIIILAILMNTDVLFLMVVQGAKLKQVKAWQLLAASGFIALWQVMSLYMGERLIFHLVGNISGFSQLGLGVMKVFSALIYLGLGIYFLYQSTKSVETKEVASTNLSIKSVLQVAILTSLDALLVGVALALRQVKIQVLYPFLLIFTAVAVVLAVYIGRYYGPRGNKVPQLISGITYIILAIYIYFN